MIAEDRALGCLWGLAIGDALGMPTQSLSPHRIAREFGRITRFEPAPPDHPLAAGLPAGSVTDDTEQALLLAELLGPGGTVDEAAWVSALIGWEAAVRERGSHDLLGPSTSAALAAWRAGEPASTTGRTALTNGAAMRIAGVGVAVPADDLALLVDRVVGASRVTHGTSIALGAAAAVAAAVSVGVSGGGLADAVPVAIDAAERGESEGVWAAGGLVSARIGWATDQVAGVGAASASRFVASYVGTGLAANESVPAAFALAWSLQDHPWDALCAAASIGGDCDTIAAITGAILGATHGMSGWPREAVETVRSVNGLDRVDDIAGRLVRLRNEVRT